MGHYLIHTDSPRELYQNFDRRSRKFSITFCNILGGIIATIWPILYFKPLDSKINLHKDGILHSLINKSSTACNRTISMAAWHRNTHKNSSYDTNITLHMQSDSLAVVISQEVRYNHNWKAHPTLSFLDVIFALQLFDNYQRPKCVNFAYLRIPEYYLLFKHHSSEDQDLKFGSTNIQRW